MLFGELFNMALSIGRGKYLYRNGLGFNAMVRGVVRDLGTAHLCFLLRLDISSG
jgi:hypothetical protein